MAWAARWMRVLGVMPSWVAKFWRRMVSAWLSVSGDMGRLQSAGFLWAIFICFDVALR